MFVSLPCHFFFDVVQLGAKYSSSFGFSWSQLYQVLSLPVTVPPQPTKHANTRAIR